MTVANSKGGVGKTTICRLLSLVMEEQEKTVCLLDFCQNSGISTGFNLDRGQFQYNIYDWLTGEAGINESVQQLEDSSIYFIPSTEKIDKLGSWVSENIPRPKQLNFLQDKLSFLDQHFDFVVIDSHPSENNEQLHMALAASDKALLVSENDIDSLIAMRRMVQIIKEFQDSDYTLDFGIILNKINNNQMKKMNNPRENLERFLPEKLIEEKFLGSIRESSLVTRSKNEGIPLNQHPSIYSRNIMDDVRNIYTNLIEGGTNNDKETREFG